MNHRSLLELSLKLVELSPNSEVVIRNGVGRLYYFCYHEALHLINSIDDLKKIYSSLHNMGSHERVATAIAKYVGQSQNLRYGTVSRLLKDMHSLRCLADYELQNYSVTKEDYFSMLTNLKLIKDFLAEMEIPYFQANIEEHIPAKIQVKKKTSLRIVE